MISFTELPKDEDSMAKRKKEESKLPSNPEEVEDFRRSSATNPLIVFTFDELRKITGNFRQDHMLGGGGFGSVYKGFLYDDELKEKVPPVPVAVKVHDGDNSYQGHREWLVTKTPISIYTNIHISMYVIFQYRVNA